MLNHGQDHTRGVVWRDGNVTKSWSSLGCPDKEAWRTVIPALYAG